MTQPTMTLTKALYVRHITGSRPIRLAAGTEIVPGWRSAGRVGFKVGNQSYVAGLTDFNEATA